MKTEFNSNGSEYISGLIAEGINNGSRTAKVSGNYLITEAVRLPSDFTLILEDCHLQVAKGHFSNIFINESLGTERAHKSDGADRNITVIGRGVAILDGGEFNGLSEHTSERDGMPPVWNNNLILFANVDGFSISGLSCHNQGWWALNFYFCRNGYLGNLDFLASDIGVDKNGNMYHGLERERYEEVLVKNADGIDLRVGCQNILIENISGFTEDDTVALTGIVGKGEKNFFVDGLTTDIANVRIRNVRSSAFCTIVRLLNQGGVRLHDIDIDGVYDTSADSPRLNRGLYAVRVGDVRLYGSRHATADETYNISIKNVYGRSDYAVSLAGDMRGLVMEGISVGDNCQLLLDERVSK